MAKKIKGFLKNERSVSKLIFSAIMIGVVILIVGNGAFSYFKRTATDANFNYGYGYGYGTAGYGYGYGYGYGAGVSGQWNYGFLGADGSATLISAAATRHSITITYSTNYLAKNAVEYGTTASLGNTSSWSDWQSGTNSITISSLNCGGTYYYRVASKDAGDNIWYTSKTTKATANCETTGAPGVFIPSITPSMPTTNTGTVTATAAAGGETTLTTTEGSTAKVTIPANAVTVNTTVVVETSDAGTLVSAGTIGDVPTGLFRIGNLVFKITATDTAGNAVTSFSKDITLTFTYTDEQVTGLDEDSLKVYRWSGTEWTALDTTVDATNNTLTATTAHLSYFTIMGKKKAVTELTVAELKAKIAEIIESITAIKAKIIELIKQKIAEIEKAILNLRARLVKIGATAYEGIPTDFTFTNNLQQGMTSDEVKYLQIILKQEIGAPTYPADVPATGYFGKITRAAVIAFQEKYATDILAPYDLTKGTGLVGKKTIAKLNALLSQSK